MKAHASPTKEFFIDMIIRDIGLEECIFDLLDNCIDGANRIAKLRNSAASKDPYAGFSARIMIDRKLFSIEDNCGGIPVDVAVDYAFHFGRRKDTPAAADSPIGLYGIGMKRAAFKIGKKISIESETDSERFKVDIDVDQWAQNPDDWDFDLEREDKRGEIGTKLSITDLREGIADEFADSTFKNTVITNIAKYYSFFIQKGFSIYVGDFKVPAYGFSLKESDSFSPVHYPYDDETGVRVIISAGLAGNPPDDISPEVKIEKREYWGWFVLCNDRVVLAGNKDKETGWGDDPFPGWHPQYNGFMGIVSFYGKASLLPWTTTKRELDTTSPIYRRALVKMKDAARPYLDYTNQRKEDLDTAKKLETSAILKSISELAQRAQMKLPEFEPKPKVEMATISYQKPRESVLAVAEMLGNRNMSGKQVGIKTFEYYVKNEIGD